MTPGTEANVPLLDDASVELIESARSAKLVAAADRSLQAGGVHAYACRVAPDRSVITVVLSRSQSATVLDSIAATRRIALVACHIKSYQTVQLKGDDAIILPPTDADRQAVVDYCRGFVEYTTELGYDGAAMRAHMACERDDAIVVRFTGRRAFNQTPGPSAGQPLAPA